MSEDAIHNPSAGTNEQTETTSQNVATGPNTTENTVESRKESLCVANHDENKNETRLVQDTTGSSMEDMAGPPPSDQADQSSAQANQARRVPGRLAGRPSLKMTKEQLMAAITEITEKLGHVPSYAELMKTGKVSGRQIVKHFATYTRALRACNLERVCGGNKLPLERLFLDWATVTRQLGKIPSKAEFAQMGKHSDTPLKSRFGSWG